MIRTYLDWLVELPWSVFTKEEIGIRDPIRGSFFGYCASAMIATASSTTINRIDKTPAFLISHTIGYVYHADGSRER